MMVTANDGGISSKIIIGSIAYLSITLALILVMFVNPCFPGLTEIVITHILTSGSLLGLTTVENIRNKRLQLESEKNDCTEDLQ